MTEKILVIGGSGLLGYHLKQNLIDFDTYFKIVSEYEKLRG